MGMAPGRDCQGKARAMPDVTVPIRTELARIAARRAARADAMLAAVGATDAVAAAYHVAADAYSMVGLHRHSLVYRARALRTSALAAALEGPGRKRTGRPTAASIEASPKLPAGVDRNVALRPGYVAPR
jgi:hypothetical protein